MIAGFKPSGRHAPAQFHSPSPWPLLIRWIAKHRQPGDEGAGDTLERLLKKVGADRAAKAWERVAGRPCGCQDRKAWMNSRYPYPG